MIGIKIMTTVYQLKAIKPNPHKALYKLATHYDYTYTDPNKPWLLHTQRWIKITYNVHWFRLSDQSIVYLTGQNLEC